MWLLIKTRKIYPMKRNMHAVLQFINIIITIYCSTQYMNILNQLYCIVAANIAISQYNVYTHTLYHACRVTLKFI